MSCSVELVACSRRLSEECRVERLQMSCGTELVAPRFAPSDPKISVGRGLESRVERHCSRVPLLHQIQKMSWSSWECRVERHYPLPSLARVGWVISVGQSRVPRHFARLIPLVRVRLPPAFGFFQFSSLFFAI